MIIDSMRAYKNGGPDWDFLLMVLIGVMSLIALYR